MVTPPGVPDETVKKMKPSFRERYGDRWKEVLYATLWKHKGSYQEETQPLDEVSEKERKKLEIFHRVAGALQYGGADVHVRKPVEFSAGDLKRFQEPAKKKERPLAPKSPSFRDQGGWDGMGNDYLDMDDEEQQGLMQALRKRARHEETEKIKNIVEHIVKHGSGYRLLSHKGKNLGTFKSKAAAAKHEGEVEYFKKHKGK